MDILQPALTRIHTLARGLLAQLPNVVIALVVFFVFYNLSRIVRSGMRTFAQRQRKHLSLGLVLGRLAQGLIVFIGMLVALVIALPGFQPAQLIQLLGISSVAVGFAFKDILQNFLAGILLLLTEPFRIGDQIKVGDFEGTVEDVQTRATFIKTYDGRRVVIPNGELFNQSVTVNTAYEQRRLQYDIGIGYGDDIARAKEILLETVRGMTEVLENPTPEALVVKLADSSINIRLRWWVKPARQFDILHSQDAVLEKVASALLAEGFDLPFPTQQILFHDQTEESDGDRSKQREGWPKGRTDVPRPARIVDALRELRQSQVDQRKGNANEVTTN